MRQLLKRQSDQGYTICLTIISYYMPHPIVKWKQEGLGTLDRSPESWLIWTVVTDEMPFKIFLF